MTLESVGRRWWFMGYGVALAGLVLASTGCNEAPPSCLPGCAGSRAYDAQAYDLRAAFDWKTFTLTAHEDITLASVTEPIVELDAEVQVDGVHAGTSKLAYTFDAAAHTLRVDLGPVLDAARSATFTVDYRAGTSDAMYVGGPRDDDPVLSRVLFTDSEPDRGRRWLVARHDPADRALFSVDLTMPLDHDAIGNGERVLDERKSDGRHVGYRLDQPIPTYLMAFAEGELEHVERTDGRFPIALWFRRGLALVPDDNLNAIEDAMSTFERLLGPYPWSRYAVVLLPQYGGGMENATLTFNTELSGQSAVGFNLNAHELAHHWFGDLVTVRAWDDLWIKEGMATFLASEAERARRDRAGTGRGFGADFTFATYTSGDFSDYGDAVVAPDLTGLDKYTSGPYQRGAWVITQLRHLVGNDAFWADLRAYLAAHALDSATSADFVGAFAAHLDEATRARVLAGLPTIKVPVIRASQLPDGGTQLRLDVRDPTAAPIAPVEVSVLDAQGLGVTVPLPPGQLVTLNVPEGGYLALDEAGVHPPWSSVFGTLGFSALPLWPSSLGPALDAFTSRSPAHQEQALLWGLPRPLSSGFTELYAALDSTLAQRNAVISGCRSLGGLDEGSLTAPLRAPAILRFDPSYAACGPTLGARLHEAELNQLAAAPSAANSARLEYLMGFDYPPTTALATMGRVAATAPSLLLRDRALQRLSAQAAGVWEAEANVPAWQAFVRGRLPVTTSQGRLLRLWRMAVSLNDASAVPVVAPLLKTVPLTEDAEVEVICGAHTFPSAWAAFQQALKPWSALAPGAQAVLANPASCPVGIRAPQAAGDETEEPDELGRFRRLAGLERR